MPSGPLQAVAHTIRSLLLRWHKKIMSRLKQMPVPSDEHRQRVSISLNAAEHRCLVALARQVGMRKTSFVKQAVSAFLDDTTFLNPDLVKAVRRCSLDIRNIGNLVNQIARYTNQYQRLRWGDAKALQAHLQAMEQCVRNLLSSSALNGYQKPGSKN